MTNFVKPTAAQAALYRQVQNYCFDLVRIIELEVSGVRDGNGTWEGSDPIGGKARDIFEALNPPADPARELADYVIANKLSLLDFRTVEKLNERFGHLNRDQVRRGLDWADAAMSGVAA